MYGQRLRAALEVESIVPFIGVYDCFSAKVAAQHYSAIFLSGFSFAASYYGLPDLGYITWSDMVALLQRVRTILPHHHIIVDIDDGYCDVEVACHVVRLLEQLGASGVMLEDQKRPRKCGHFKDKTLLSQDDYLFKLEQVLTVRKDLFIMARTDALEPEDRLRRAKAYANAGADAVLVEAIDSLDTIHTLKPQISTPLVVNQIAGGKSPVWPLSTLSAAGVNLVLYSTPTLFAAQSAIENVLNHLKAHDGLLPDISNHSGVEGCTQLLKSELPI